MSWTKLCGVTAGEQWCVMQPIWLKDFAVILGLGASLALIMWCFYDLFKHPENWEENK